MNRLFSACLPALAAALAIAPAGSAQSGPQTITATYSYSGDPLPIFADAADIITVADIRVNRALQISNITARVRVSFPQVGDLKVYLFSPKGTRTKLLENNCGSLQNIDTTFDDAAQSRYSDFCPTEAGRGPYRGNEPLANSKDESSVGIWRLAVENDHSDRNGYILEFSVTITGTEQVTPTLAPNGVRVASSLQERPIAPGSYLSLFGGALGPFPGLESNDPFWPTWMDGTVARFNEQDGSMKALSTFRIDVQVPIELDLSKPAEVYVYRQGRVTNKLSVPVTPAAPGVVTRNAIGTGQAVAINADGSDNPSTKRAGPGSTIRITATGLGRTQPPVAAGQYPGVTPPPPTVLPVYANIGGQPAQVGSATAAAGKVALYEVQVVVPGGLPSGAWEVILSAGYYSSQPGAVIFVQ